MWPKDKPTTLYIDLKNKTNQVALRSFLKTESYSWKDFSWSVTENEKGLKSEPYDENLCNSCNSVIWHFTRAFFLMFNIDIYWYLDLWVYNNIAENYNTQAINGIEL